LAISRAGAAAGKAQSPGGLYTSLLLAAILIKRMDVE